MSNCEDNLNDTICDDFLIDTEDFEQKNVLSPEKLQLKLCGLHGQFNEESPITVISKNLSGTCIKDELDDDNDHGKFFFSFLFLLRILSMKFSSSHNINNITTK